MILVGKAHCISVSCQVSVYTCVCGIRKSLELVIRTHKPLFCTGFLVAPDGTAVVSKQHFTAHLDAVDVECSFRDVNIVTESYGGNGGRTIVRVIFQCSSRLVEVDLVQRRQRTTSARTAEAAAATISAAASRNYLLHVCLGGNSIRTAERRVLT